MSKMPISSFTSTATQNLRGNTQLRADNQGGLTGVVRNKFKQFFSAITRTEADRAANRAATQSYVNHIRGTLGFEASVIAGEALANRLRAGNPLSMRKIRAVESQLAEAARTKIERPVEKTKFTAADFIRFGERIGGGANNQIRAAEYRNGRYGFEGALKAMAPDSGHMLMRSDASYNPNEHLLIERNLASAKLAETLGMPVIAGGYRVEDETGSPALLMELVKGRPSEAQLGEVNHTSDGPELRRGLVALQIIDVLTAQADRNLNNILIKNDLGRESPVGIDNDLSFGTAENVSEWHSQINPAAKPVGLPVVIDRSMQQAIEGLDERALKDVMGEKLASPARLSAAMSRLNELKAHIASDKVIVIGDNEWDTVAVENKLGEGKDNYWYQIMKQPIAVAMRDVSQPTQNEILDDLVATWSSSNNNKSEPQKFNLENGFVLTLPYQPAADFITRGEIHYNGERLIMSGSRSPTGKSPNEVAQSSARALSEFIQDKFKTAPGTPEFDHIVRNLTQFTHQGAALKAVVKGAAVGAQQPAGQWFAADHPEPFSFRLEVNETGNISIRETTRVGLSASGSNSQFISALETTRTYDLSGSALRSEQFDPRTAISNARGEDRVQDR